MLNQNWILIGILISALGSASYIKATLNGEIKPNRITFLVISLAPLLAFAAQAGKGLSLVSLFILSAGLFPLLIFLATFVNKKAYWKLGILDMSCGALSLIGLILWYVTKDGNTATTLSIGADLLATFPTIAKAYKHPETEKAWPWLANSIGAILTLLTIKNWAFTEYGFTFYAALVTLLIFMLAQFRTKKKI